MSGFFKLSTAKDMFEKARREYGRLQSESSVDNIFNFFVTAYHFFDYLGMEKQISEEAVRAFRNEPDMQRCAHVCNMGKHAVLTQGDFDQNKKKGVPRPSPISKVESGAYGCNSYGTYAYGASPVMALYYPDTQERVAILPLADRVMQLLESFIGKHNL